MLAQTSLKEAIIQRLGNVLCPGSTSHFMLLTRTLVLVGFWFFFSLFHLWMGRKLQALGEVGSVTCRHGKLCVFPCYKSQQCSCIVQYDWVNPICNKLTSFFLSITYFTDLLALRKRRKKDTGSCILNSIASWILKRSPRMEWNLLSCLSRYVRHGGMERLLGAVLVSSCVCRPGNLPSWARLRNRVLLPWSLAWDPLCRGAEDFFWQKGVRLERKKVKWMRAPKGRNLKLLKYF